MHPLVEELAQTELFEGVPDSILEVIQSNNKAIELHEGEVLLSPEQENHHIYLLLSGTLGLHFGSINSPEIRILKPGVTVGEISIIDFCMPSAFVVARETCRVFPIHRELIQQFVSDANPVVRNLLKVLTNWIRVNTEYMDSNNSKIGELTTHASTDALTGLYNRRWLDNAIVHFLDEAIETGKSLCLLMIDVDQFKRYNDTFGHSAGDQALTALGYTLKNAIRPQDFASRFGGEEFLILLPHTTIAESTFVAERIRHTIESKPITTSDGAALPGVTVSIGLAVSNHESTPQILIDCADAKLYEAKQDGRNCIRF